MIAMHAMRSALDRGSEAMARGAASTHTLHTLLVHLWFNRPTEIDGLTDVLLIALYVYIAYAWS